MGCAAGRGRPHQLAFKSFDFLPRCVLGSVHLSLSLPCPPVCQLYSFPMALSSQDMFWSDSHPSLPSLSLCTGLKGSLWGAFPYPSFWCPVLYLGLGCRLLGSCLCTLASVLAVPVSAMPSSLPCLASAVTFPAQAWLVLYILLPAVSFLSSISAH